MLAKIVGISWIILGFLWVLKPGALKNRLKKKMNRKMKWVVYGFILMFAFMLIGAIIKAQGFLPKVVGLIGLVVAIRSVTLVMSKASGKVSAWWEARPLVFFRIWALIIFATGIALVFI